MCRPAKGDWHKQFQEDTNKWDNDSDKEPALLRFESKIEKIERQTEDWKEWSPEFICRRRWLALPWLGRGARQRGGPTRMSGSAQLYLFRTYPNYACWIHSMLDPDTAGPRPGWLIYPKKKHQLFFYFLFLFLNF